MQKFLIEIGNTNIKIFREDERVKRITIDSFDRAEDVIEDLIEGGKIPYFVISSVVPDYTDKFIDYFEMFNYEYAVLNGDNYSEFYPYKKVELRELGADRMLNIIAADKESSKNIIFDLGTALTLDVVKDYEYITGFITPGLELMKNSLTSGTAQLEDFNFHRVEKSGRWLTTDSQINGGVLLSMVSILNDSVLKLNKLIPTEDFKIFLTGGGFDVLFDTIGEEEMREMLDFSYEYRKNLGIEGLNIVAEKKFGR